MNIRLKPELEKRVQQDVERGPYRTADEFVEHAVVLLHEQETWLAQHAAKIGTKISEGYTPAKRGELIDAEQVRQSLDQRSAHGLLTSARHDRLPVHPTGTRRPFRDLELHRAG